MDNDFFYPIHDIIPDREGHGMVIGKNGSLTYVVRLSSPEVYSLYKDELATRHAVFVQAFSHMPDNSWVHKQDIFRSLPFQSTGVGMSYLAKSDQEHFSGRKYLKHSCMIAFTLAGIQSLSSAYVKNIFSFKENLSGEDSERLDEFLSAVEFAINNLSALRNTRIDFLSLDELREYLFLSANFSEKNGIRDIHFEEQITAGNTKARVYAITDDEFLPEQYPVYGKDYTVSKDKSELYMSPSEAFGGIHLNHNHVYNQILYFYSDKKLKDTLRRNLDSHIANRGWDRINSPAKIAKMTELVKEIKDNNEILCYAHYSVVLWEEDTQQLELAEKELRSSLDLFDLKYYIPSYGNLADLYAGGIVGCVSSLRLEYMFMTSLSLAVAFFVHYTGFSDDPDGILFNDRLTQIPLRKDIWDANNRRIKARNAVVIAPTGSGKSFLTNNIIHQLLDKDFTVVGVEFGNSFKQLCYLYPEIAIHIEYDQNQPLGINPFDLGGSPMTPEKEETLVALCLRFWQNSSTDPNLTVALRKMLSQYYCDVSQGHSFPGFYTYLTQNYESLCEKCDIRPDYFDIDSFRHVCSEFMPGKSYANLCAAEGVTSSLSDKRFIHFELTKVKANPFVASVVMSLLFDVINNKILSDPSKKGYIIFDEYAETAQMKSSNSLQGDIHQTVAFFYQKIRKENGAVMTIIQSPFQLPENEYTKGIIANTQLLYVLEGTEVVYDAVIKTFMIKNNAHINQMKSIQNNYDCTHPYSECWIRFGENYALTVRLEASARKYLAFQTQGEKRAALDRLYSTNGHDMQTAIETYLTSKK